MYDQSPFSPAQASFLLILLSKQYAHHINFVLYIYDIHHTWKHSCWIFLECCLTMVCLWWFMYIYTQLYWHKTQSTLKMHSDVTSNSQSVWLSLIHLCVQVFQQELPDSIQDTWDHLTEEPDRVPECRWRYVSPKSLMDNFCHTMHCLFSECFFSTEAQQDCEYDAEKVWNPPVTLQVVIKYLKEIDMFYFSTWM